MESLLDYLNVNVAPCLTTPSSRLATRQPHNNWDFRVRTSAGGTHSPSCKNRLDVFRQTLGIHEQITFILDPIPDGLDVVKYIDEKESDNVGAPELIPPQSAAPPSYHQHPTQQCSTVDINMELTPDSGNPVIASGVQVHPADNQSLFGSKYFLPVRPTPCRFQETARKGCNGLSQMTCYPVAAPEPSLAPSSNQQQPSQQSTTDAESDTELTPVSKHNLPQCPMPFNTKEPARKGSNSLSQTMPDLRPAPDLFPPQYPTTTLCLQQQKQRYTSAAKSKILSDLHQEHPSLAKSGHGCGPADKTSLFLSPVNQEHLASGYVKGFNGLSSTSSHNKMNNYEKNTTQNEKSNGNASSNRFPRKNQREYTKEELEKMRRNNEASKRSREKRRMEEKNRERERENLEIKNKRLKEKLNTMKTEYNKGSAQMFRMLTIIAQRTRELNDLDTNWTTDNPNLQSDRFNLN